ncbi:BglG family transcription antiterminator [Virgibacillus necropolis]|uniref:Transcriptional antiterminator n=1 Tax=Virgibacillus necropolis TaxID=163877 RepID=A0A221M9G7_9BACI|nr:BglG family transcription antiterminator [Virgibacillus necropolis]ASN04293.1 transcriptional antiterminator [Virgibacillus necropolis]
MNDRQKELLHILLLDQNVALLVQDLSKRLHCSEKTVRNDLKHIEEFIKPYPSASLIRKPGLGVYLEIDSGERSQLFQLLFSKGSKSEEERIIEMTYQLLVSDKPISLQRFAEQYYIHKTAIKKDLEKVTKWLDRFDLMLVSKQRLGNTITGTELNKRSALAHLSQLVAPVPGNMNYVIDLFLPYEITTVKKALMDLQHNYSVAFTDGAMESLLVHALIMIKRTRQRSTVSIPDSKKESIYQTNEYQYTKDFLNQLEYAFRLSFPEEELIYFTWHLISCKKTDDQSNRFLGLNDNLARITTEITSKLKQLTMINFEEDSVLMDGLTVHMDTVINRLTYGFPITNPLLSDIKKMYPYMFSMVVLTLEDMNESYHLTIPEDEAAYLVLHFQASIERLQKKKDTNKSVLIVCHMGIGMSHLLRAKLEQNYKGITILDCIGKTEVSEFINHNSVDFIISTVPLKNVTVSHIVISPLLEAKDKNKLEQFFHQAENEATNYQGNSYLSKLINRDLIYLNVDSEHRFKVVEKLANALFQKGFVDKEFVHSTLFREKSSATSIGGAIAIPHGSPSLVKHSVVAVAVLAEPLEWGDEMVSIVFMLAVSNERDNPTKELIQQIASFSDQPMLVEAITAANDPSDILILLDK